MTELGKFGIALASDELTLSAAVTPRHRSLLASYRMNAHRGADAARNLIIGDLRRFLDLGALDRATDQLIVLALLMRETARSERRLVATRRHRDLIALQRGRAARPHYAVSNARGERSPTLRLIAPGELTTTVEDEEKV